MGARIGVGLLGLGTVGGGVASILLSPQERHPLVADLELILVAVRDLERPRPVDLSPEQLTTDPQTVVEDPRVDVVVEVEEVVLVVLGVLVALAVQVLKVAPVVQVLKAAPVEQVQQVVQ